MNRRTRSRSLLGAIVAVLLTVSTSTAQNQTPTELVVAVTAIGNTLDTTVANFTNTTIAMNHVYDRIIMFDANFEFVPGVAQSWEYVDATTFRFTLGDGFMFHNGAPLTPQDVIFSIERLRDIPRVTSIMNNIASVEVTGDAEITIKLVEPNSSTIRELVADVPVMNEVYATTPGTDYANQPIGTGPYVVANYIPGDRLVLERWDDYPFAAPAIERIVFRTIPEDANRYIAAETGEAQFAVISYHDVARAESNPRLNLVQQRTTNTAFISMNTQKAPFDNTNVRLAMAYATDKEGLAIVQGGSTVIDSMTPTMFSTYYASPDLPTFDLERAQQLLAAEGYGPSNPLKFEMWTYGANTAVAETYQALLSAIGVEMSIRNLEFGVFLEGMARGEYQMLSGSWNNVTGNPMSSLENYWTGSYGARNISFFNNARVDELYTLAKGTIDQQVLLDAAREVQDIAAANMPIIPTFTTISNYAVDARLVGVETFPSNMYTFRNARFE
ncbi:MAG: ABC transporter substrate-binding protein [Trueperaceae bacterium]|nr:ABC transporter substrate-binding protein [Trueperaceae bacterium]